MFHIQLYHDFYLLSNSYINFNVFSVIARGRGGRGCGWGVVILFTATFSNILVILWQSVLLMEETRVPGENH
jgi:hypothetical protein